MHSLARCTVEQIMKEHGRRNGGDWPRLAPALFKWLLGTSLCCLFLAFERPAQATVDGGREARLCGSFEGQRYAFVVETGLQEGCAHRDCLAYALDLEQAEFALLWPRRLEPRRKVLENELCSKLSKEACDKSVSKRLLQEEVRKDNGCPLLAKQYLGALKGEQRKALGRFSKPPKPLETSADGSHAPQFEIAIPAVSTGGRSRSWTLFLEERWTVPSYRAYHDDEACRPEQRSSCGKKERWEDGVRSQRWVCQGPCAGLASVVRATAKTQVGDRTIRRVGRTVLVEPGAIASYAVGMVNAKRVPIRSLTFPDYAQRAYLLGRSAVVVGAFVEGAGHNGTWFPLAIAFQRNPKKRVESSTKLAESADAASKKRATNKIAKIDKERRACPGDTKGRNLNEVTPRRGGSKSCCSLALLPQGLPRTPAVFWSFLVLVWMRRWRACL